MKCHAMDNICFFASKGTRLSPHTERQAGRAVVRVREHGRYVVSAGTTQAEPTHPQVSALFSRPAAPQLKAGN